MVVRAGYRARSRNQLPKLTFLFILLEKNVSIRAKSSPVEHSGGCMKRGTERIFPEAAIERLSNPEQLDHVVGVTGRSTG